MFRSNYFRAYGFWHCGEGFQTILLMWYMTFHANLEATAIGFYQSLQLAPFLLFTAIGGSLTDRIGARASFAASTGLFALTLCLYGLVDHEIGFNGPAFAAYCLLSGLLSAVSNPGIDTFIPEATDRPPQDNALLAATVHNGAKLTGNAATLVLPALGAMGGFVVNGLLMAASVVFLRRHTRAAARPPARPAGEGRAMARAVGHFRSHPHSFDIFLGSVMLGLLVIPSFYIFMPLTLRTWYPEQSGLMGLIGIMGWIGAILASSAMARLSPKIRHPGRVALAVWAGAGLLFMALQLAPGFLSYLGILLLLGGNSVGKALVYGTFLQEAPASDRALLIGIDQTAFWGLATLGTTLMGWLVDRFGLDTMLTANGLAILASVAVLGLRGRLWALRPA